MPHFLSSPRIASLALAATLAVAAGSAALLALPQPARAQTAATAPSPGSFAAALARLQSANGQSDAIEDAAAQFRKLSAADPADPVLRAYTGAATSLLATTTVLPWKKLGHAEDGLALIDKALAQLTPDHDAPAHRGVPASLETRFTAASTFLAVPAFMNRGERGRKLLDEVLKSAHFEASPLPFRAAVWLRAGQLAAAEQRGAEARQFYERVVASNAPQAEQARNRLKEL